MPKTRQIKHDFFLNEKLAKKSPYARLLFIGLWLICDREGRLEYRPEKIKALLFPYENVDVGALLSELSTELSTYAQPVINMWTTLCITYIQVVNFKKHQHIHPDEKQSEIQPPKKTNPNKFQEIPGNPRKSQEIMHNNTASVSASVPSPSPNTTAVGPAGGNGACGYVDKSVDKSMLLIWKIHGAHNGKKIIDLPADYCDWALKNLVNLGQEYREALQMRIEIKSQEKKAMPLIPGAVPKTFK